MSSSNDVLVCLVPFVLAEGMLESQDYFQDGKVNKTALVSFIRDIKKNTKLSDEDAAVIAASKVNQNHGNMANLIKIKGSVLFHLYLSKNSATMTF